MTPNTIHLAETTKALVDEARDKRASRPTTSIGVFSVEHKGFDSTGDRQGRRGSAAGAVRVGQTVRDAEDGSAASFRDAHGPTPDDSSFRAAGLFRKPRTVRQRSEKF